MTRKRTLVFWLLVAFAIWPLVHHALVRTVGIDPWKYGGWSMYIVPQHPPLVDVAIETRAGWLDVPIERLGEPVQRYLVAFGGFRRIKREGLPPDGLAKLVFAERSDALRVRIRVRDFSLDPETARVHYTPHEYAYSRGS